MFNKDFYPTDKSTFDLMQIDCRDKVVLEPQAGRGDMVLFLKDAGAKEVLACELNEDLAKIVTTKAKFLKHDFFKVKAQEISHINAIVMNPPFSNGSKHVLHAWNIAPTGCEITALVNFETIDNTFSKDRKQLISLIHDYGYSVNLGECFSNADRTTNIEVGLIKLQKPADAHSEFEGFFMDEDVEQAQTGSGIMPFNAVRDVVQRYVNSVKCFEEHLVISEKMNKLNSLFDVESFSFHIDYDNKVTTKDEYKKGLQKKAWEYLFNVMNLKKYVTSGVMKDINNFVETQTKVPFTMKNIYKMFEIIIGTRQQTFERSLVEAIDKFTQHTHENRYNLEGWKTNAGYLLNKKIIVPYMINKDWNGRMEIRHSQYQDNIKDIMKVICSLTGKNFDDFISLDDLLRYRYKIYSEGKHIASFRESESELLHLQSQKDDLEKRGVKYTVDDSPASFGKWMDWGFFRIKGFKKGTLHMQFKDEKVWETVNRAYGKIKGQVLPEKI